MTGTTITARRPPNTDEHLKPMGNLGRDLFEPDRVFLEWAFETLAECLKTERLPTETSGPRRAEADEFMLMHVNRYSGQVRVAFKHCDTRNYLALVVAYGHLTSKYECAASAQLAIPCTSEPFLRGYFDKLSA